MVTSTEVMELLGVSRNTLYAMIKRGDLTPLPKNPFVRREPTLRFRREDIEKLLHR